MLCVYQIGFKPFTIETNTKHLSYGKLLPVEGNSENPEKKPELPQKKYFWGITGGLPGGRGRSAMAVGGQGASGQVAQQA